MRSAFAFIQRVLVFSCVCLLFPSDALAADFDSSVDVIIDIGHGGVDGGAVYGNVLEKDINLQVGTLLYQMLAKDGYHVIMNRWDDRALSEDNRWLNSSSRHRKDLAQRQLLASALRPQMLVSLHVNWASDASERGPVVLYQKHNQSFMLADLIEHSLHDVYGIKAEPRASKKLYMLRHTYCPSVIVEMGFISNGHDRQMLTNPTEQKRIAEAIKNAISEYCLLVGRFQTESEVPLMQR